MNNTIKDMAEEISQKRFDYVCQTGKSPRAIILTREQAAALTIFRDEVGFQTSGRDKNGLITDLSGTPVYIADEIITGVATVINLDLSLRRARKEIYDLAETVDWLAKFAKRNFQEFDWCRKCGRMTDVYHCYLDKDRFLVCEECLTANDDYKSE